MTSVVLRNVFDLQKYPGDAGFHQHLLQNTTLLCIKFNPITAFNRLPHASRHTHGIATVTITIQSGKPFDAHSVAVFETVVDQGKEGEELGKERRREVLQTTLVRDGLGTLDTLLCQKYTKKVLIANWLGLTQTSCS